MRLPDKGNGVVILNKHDYNKKMDEILSDTSKFEPLKDDAIKLTLKRENQVKTLLKNLKADNCIDERTCNELHPTGTRIGIPYGIPKIHKSSIPLIEASFDVISLFTNIPVYETIEIISNRIFANCMYFEGLAARSSLSFYLFLSKTVIFRLMVGFMNRLMAWLWESP